jgi:putative membrane protein
MQWWCAAQDVAWSWTWRPYPGVWLFIGLLAAGFVALHRRHPSSDDALRPGVRRALAAAGLLLLWIALDWPVGALGSGYLASVHMVQFLLIALSAPPLLLLGVPRAALVGFVGRPVAGRVVAFIGHPIVALGSFVALMGLTHWPLVVDRLMADQAGSFLLDMVWLVSGLVFWWPVAVGLPQRRWLEEPFKIGYLIAATLVNTGVFAFLTFSDVPVYATFELAPPVGMLSTRDDQLVAGLLMKLGGAVVLWTSISILFFRWVGRSSREDGGDRRPTAAAVLLTVVGLASCGPTETVLEGPVVIGEPVTAERGALYLTARAGGGDDLLQRVEVSGVTEASLHRTLQVDGMMSMQAAPEGFELGAGELLRLRPGGHHAMLEGLPSRWLAGDSLQVTLHFRSGPLTAWARVVPLADLEDVLVR